MTVFKPSALILSSVLALGCMETTFNSEPESHNPGPVKPVPDPDLITQMCGLLREKGCEEGKDVYNDDLPGPVDVPNQKCEAYYNGLEKSGIMVNPKCILKITSCEVIEDFRAKDPKECE